MGCLTASGTGAEFEDVGRGEAEAFRSPPNVMSRSGCRRRGERLARWCPSLQPGKYFLSGQVELFEEAWR